MDVSEFFSPEEQAHQGQRRERRAHLRTENHMRPRCARCEADMLRLLAGDVLDQQAFGVVTTSLPAVSNTSGDTRN